MKERVGEVFAGTISAVTAFGIFVALDAIYIEGLVRPELGEDYFQFDPIKHQMLWRAQRQAFPSRRPGPGQAGTCRPGKQQDRFRCWRPLMPRGRRGSCRRRRHLIPGAGAAGRQPARVGSGGSPGRMSRPPAKPCRRRKSGSQACRQKAAPLQDRGKAPAKKAAKSGARSDPDGAGRSDEINPSGRLNRLRPLAVNLPGTSIGRNLVVHTCNAQTDLDELIGSEQWEGSRLLFRLRPAGAGHAQGRGTGPGEQRRAIGP